MKAKIFNSQGVKAIIDGKKTMFREVCKAQPSFIVDEEKLSITFGSDFFKPKFKVGQEISVKHQESLITLKIKSVKVERLRDISNDDAIAEAPQYSIIDPFRNKTPIDLFKILWNYTHKKPEEKWGANPWVFVYEFEVLDLKK